MSTYTPITETLDDLAALFDAYHAAGAVPIGGAEWRDYCAGMADLYGRLYWCLTRTVEYPPMWQRMALLTSRDYWAREAEHFDQ